MQAAIFYFPGKNGSYKYYKSTLSYTKENSVRIQAVLNNLKHLFPLEEWWVMPEDMWLEQVGSSEVSPIVFRLF